MFPGCSAAPPRSKRGEKSQCKKKKNETHRNLLSSVMNSKLTILPTVPISVQVIYVQLYSSNLPHTASHRRCYFNQDKSLFSEKSLFLKEAA